jgi:hypothetical protein
MSFFAIRIDKRTMLDWLIRRVKVANVYPIAHKTTNPIVAGKNFAVRDMGVGEMLAHMVISLT